MQILFITDTDIDGLGGTTHVEITRAIREIGHAIVPIFLADIKLREYQDVSPMYLLRYKSKSLTASLMLYIELVSILIRDISKFDFVIVAPHSALLLVPFSIMNRFFHKMPKIIIDVRTQPVEVPDNWRGQITKLKFAMSVKAASRYFNGFLVITESMAEYLRNIADIHLPIGIWTSGVNLDVFDPNRPYLPISYFEDRFVVMYHGVFSPTRGLDKIILAIDKLKQEYPEILMCFLGSGVMKEKMESMITEMGLSENVIILGSVAQNQVPHYLRYAHIGILAFPDHEWWSVQSPLKLFEYFAMEKPVIASDIPMNRNVIGTKYIAFYIADNSPEEIYRGLKSAIEKRYLLETMGREGRILVENEYTWKCQAHKIIDYLRNCSQ